VNPCARAKVPSSSRSRSRGARFSNGRCSAASLPRSSPVSPYRAASAWPGWEGGFPALPVGGPTALAGSVDRRSSGSASSRQHQAVDWGILVIGSAAPPDQGSFRARPRARPNGEASASKRRRPERHRFECGLDSNRTRRTGAGVMCVWDGTYTAPEAEREAMDQIPGWHDDTAPIRERRHARALVWRREQRRTRSYLSAA
jgi:hypothetical protein